MKDIEAGGSGMGIDAEIQGVSVANQTQESNQGPKLETLTVKLSDFDDLAALNQQEG